MYFWYIYKFPYFQNNLIQEILKFQHQTIENQLNWLKILYQATFWKESLFLIPISNFSVSIQSILRIAFQWEWNKLHFLIGIIGTFQLESCTMTEQCTLLSLSCSSHNVLMNGRGEWVHHMFAVMIYLNGMNRSFLVFFFYFFENSFFCD